jgi:hypothetical protein
MACVMKRPIVYITCDCILGVCTLVATFAFILHPTEPSLLESSTRICSVKNMLMIGATSEREILFQSRGKAIYVDTISGTQASTVDLNSRLARTASDGTWLLSNDRKWLLCSGNPRKFMDMSIIELHGPRILHIPRFRGSFGWLPDNHRIFTIVNNNAASRVNIHDILSGSNEVFLVSRLPGNYLLGTVDRSSAVTADWSPYSTRTVDVFKFFLGPDASPFKKTIRVPQGADVSEIVLSPAGDRLIWQVRFDRAGLSGMKEWLGRIPGIRPTQTSTDSLWVSQLDGTRFHKIGDIPAERYYDYDSDLRQLCWSTDGKSIYFTFKNTLYRAYSR